MFSRLLKPKVPSKCPNPSASTCNTRIKNNILGSRSPLCDARRLYSERGRSHHVRRGLRALTWKRSAYDVATGSIASYTVTVAGRRSPPRCLCIATRRSLMKGTGLLLSAMFDARPDNPKLILIRTAVTVSRGLAQSEIQAYYNTSQLPIKSRFSITWATSLSNRI